MVVWFSFVFFIMFFGHGPPINQILLAEPCMCFLIIFRHYRAPMAMNELEWILSLGDLVSLLSLSLSLSPYLCTKALNAFTFFVYILVQIHRFGMRIWIRFWHELEIKFFSHYFQNHPLIRRPTNKIKLISFYGDAVFLCCYHFCFHYNN